MDVNKYIASYGDVNEIVNVARESFEETYKPLTEKQRKYQLQRYTPEIITGWIRDPNMVLTVVYVNDNMAGFSLLILPGGKYESDIVKDMHAEVGKLYLLSKYKRMGIGRTLINEFERICRENKLHILYLGVYQKNQDAINFYENVGFVKSRNPMRYLRNKRKVYNLRMIKMIK